MRVNLNFTNKGKVAVDNFNNEELLEIFTRYMNTLVKKYDLEISVLPELNPAILQEGRIIVMVENVNCDINQFFKELEKDVKVPLKKRLEGKLDNVFKTEIFS